MTTDAPNFGLLLAPVLTRVDDASRPRFLALLERTAADRYRQWAVDDPEHGEVLLACARREDEIADRIEAVFPVPETKLAELLTLVPEAKALYYGAFTGRTVHEQIQIQADAELQGANAWRSIAKAVTDPDVLRELAHCSALEETSSAAARALFK